MLEKTCKLNCVGTRRMKRRVLFNLFAKLYGLGNTRGYFNSLVGLCVCVLFGLDFRFSEFIAKSFFGHKTILCCFLSIRNRYCV